jgi:hypothetical protein
MTYKVYDGDGHTLWRSPVVEHEKDEMVAQLGRAHRHFKNTFTGFDSSLNRDGGLTLGSLPDMFQIKEQRDQDLEFLKQERNFSGYRFYNIFALTSPSPLFWQLFQDIRTVVRTTLDTSDPLWMQCWMNYHRPEDVLKWHDHKFPYHGYVSIDPKKSTTKFRNGTGPILYEIKNEVGNIYFGAGFNRYHQVFVDEPFEGARITLGFDIQVEPDLPDDQFSLIPLL